MNWRWTIGRPPRCAAVNPTTGCPLCRMKFCAIGGIWSAGQLEAGGDSMTLEIFGKRLRMDPEFIRKVLDEPAALNNYLWRHVPAMALADVERQFYVFTRDQLAWYLAQYMPALASA